VAERYVAANSHSEHDTIAKFRRDNGVAFDAAFEQVLLLAMGAGLLQLGTVSVDGTKIDANAAKVKSICYDRLQSLRAMLCPKRFWPMQATPVKRLSTTSRRARSNL